jgi:AcrR family transcriptional regulator
VPLPRFEKLELDRRERLLATAAEEFAAHGFDGASLSRIAEAAGFSKPALYYYFADKADLYGAAISEAWRVFLPDQPLDLEALDAASYWPELKRLHEVTLEKCREKPWLVAASRLIYHPEDAGRAAPVLEELGRKAHALRTKVLRRGRALGVVRRDLPEDLVLAVLKEADQAADHWLLDHWEELTPAERETLSLKVFDIARAILSPAPEDGP